MSEELTRFFNKINFNNNDEFKDSSVLKVTVNSKTEAMTVYIKCIFLPKYNTLKELFKSVDKGIEGIKELNVKLSYDNLTIDDRLNFFKNIFNEIKNTHPSLEGINNDDISFKDDNYIIEVISKLECSNLKEETKSIIQIFKKYGLGDIKVKCIINKDKHELIKKEIKEKTKEEVNIKKSTVNNKSNLRVNMDSDSNLIYGRDIKGNITLLNNVIGEEKNVIVEAYVFGMDTRENDKLDLITLKISDKTNSIVAKFRIWKNNHEDYLQLIKKIKVNKWYKFRGNIELDQFEKDIVLFINDLESIEAKEEKVEDLESEKRVELHAHTMMSTMDSVVGLDLNKHTIDLVSHAIKLGHKGVAITDHNGCQAFPIAFENIKAFNKGKEEKDKFKGLYGTEINVVNDDVDIIFNVNDNNYDLLQDEFVVFDTETTGFYMGSDQMIEIGAVIVKNGEILDRFDELIDPKKPIPKKITELTNITDEMLKGKESEESVTKRFLAWVKDRPMVAHNAKFDIGFINAAVKKYKLNEFTNTTVDTMAIARMLHPEWNNHKLSTLVKRLDVPWNEDEHHRADYDAEGTALCFYKMCKIMYDMNIEYTLDILNTVDTKELVKFTIPFHMTMIAKNQTGLKNMFRIISEANTTYLFRNDQPKLPRKELKKYHDGLLFGSGCINGEIFEAAKTKDDEELSNMMQFYDYIEVQPISAMSHLLQSESSGFKTEHQLQEHIKKIIRVAKSAGKLVVATGDVHNLTSDDKIYRQIIVRQKNNGRLHPLNRYGIDVPDMKFMTTREMLDAFSFLDEEERKEIVITNPNKICDIVEHIEVIIDTNGRPFAPTIKDSAKITEDMVRNKAKELYGDKLPEIVQDRVDQELKGIIGANYDVIYLIAQKLVKKSNDDGFLVGSRGSVGSSFVATMMGITEVNPLPPHYRCPNCKKSIFNLDNGDSLGSIYSSGFDLPDKACPNCNTLMAKDGQDMPFATFLGFNADKVPDIDLNFSDLNQAATHEYTKVLFGVDNVYRAGTISTVADKTAFGYVKGYCEDHNIVLRKPEIERLAIGCTGVKRTTGQHPGGIVVIPEYMDVFDFTPFQYPAEDPTASWRTTHFDYHSIQDDVLKLDILGHTDPTQLRMIQDMTGMDVTKVPLDDKETMGIFLSPKPLGVTSEQINCPTGTLGVPEFGTNFTIGMLTDTKPSSFAELVKISGLSHGTDVWLGNAQELIKKKIVPFKEVIGCRDDIMVYLMYHGVEPLKAFKIMEFVRKGKASKDPDGWKEFVSVMKEAKIPEWYIDSCQKIKYMFPKAHAAAYVTSAFRIAWFKVHVPEVYYATYFSTRFDDFDLETMINGYNSIKNKMIEIQNKGYEATNKELSVLETLKLCLEATARGFNFGVIDIEKSDGKNFILSEDKKTLICPFRTLDGLGDSVANKIMEERQKGPFISIEDFQNRCKVSTTTIDKLRTLHVFDGLPESNQLSLF